MEWYKVRRKSDGKFIRRHSFGHFIFGQGTLYSQKRFNSAVYTLKYVRRVFPNETFEIVLFHLTESHVVEEW